ncbi:hypothetical protein OsJ_21582 [Oryza sativa Japonica Group]|uniref:Uncharacterized protein n=1 Tax=Oryza sativa subsp. japonica TaxID=39947 RepID=B9FTL9_ORYSJ|nr:hypothetical protein OsJ_21582 [Oryza sativa Japonica Group]
MVDIKQTTGQPSEVDPDNIIPITLDKLTPEQKQEFEQMMNNLKSKYLHSFKQTRSGTVIQRYKLKMKSFRRKIQQKPLTIELIKSSMIHGIPQSKLGRFTNAPLTVANLSSALLHMGWKREGGAGCRVLNRSICWLGGDDVGREQAAEAEPVPLRHREPRALQRSHATRISTLPRCRERRTQGRNTRVEPWVVEDVGAALEEHHGAVALRRDEPVRQQEEVVVVIPAAATARWPQPRPRERERKPRRGPPMGAPGTSGRGKGSGRCRRALQRLRCPSASSTRRRMPACKRRGGRKPAW